MKRQTIFVFYPPLGMLEVPKSVTHIAVNQDGTLVFGNTELKHSEKGTIWFSPDGDYWRGGRVDLEGEDWKQTQMPVSYSGDLEKDLMDHGLSLHGLRTTGHSQLSDAFRAGANWYKSIYKMEN